MSQAFLYKQYLEQIVPALMKELGYKNIHQVPKVLKIVLNTGFGDEMDKGGLEDLRKDFASIAGQSPVICKARISVSNFKVREGMPVGLMVTLRGEIMWDFLFRLLAISLPNIRDFRGVSSRLDGHGNYTLGITDHSIFPEINVERQRTNIGLDISIVTSAPSDKEGHALLSHLGMPFRKSSSDQKTEEDAAA
ncbi:MAG: 50S ribosomal protein L5 [Opitutae bacterium]|jgi:large subunit ribosomal protein L5|nr:50S ribosomal protein L5 [Opitutae bacterium]|tara:strand:+ start:7977 stop:8555 length:579 start_codon:yes stop_codon:yes gene_type:complete